MRKTGQRAEPKATEVSVATWIPGTGSITRQVASRDTHGAYSLFEVAIEPGVGSCLHIQHREFECIYVLEGEFEVVCDGETFAVGAGKVVRIPVGVLHGYRNVGRGTGRLLMLHTPGGTHEDFFSEAEHLGGLSPQGLDFGAISLIAARYGVEYVEEGFYGLAESEVRPP